MKLKQDLFQLVNTLTKTEKRYIKVNCDTLTKEKCYLKLFDAIEKMEEFHEETLKENTKEILNYSQGKNYLFNLILKNLRAYNAEKNIGSILSGYIADISHLFEKGLHTPCARKIAKAKKLAYLYDEHINLLQLLSWERKLLKFNNSSNLKEAMKKLADEKKAVLDLINIESELNDLGDQMIIILKQSPSTVANENKKRADILIRKPVLKNHEKFSSFTSKRLYYSIRVIYYEANCDKKEAVYWYKKIIKLWEDRPHMILTDSDNYKTCIYNYLTNCIYLQNFDDFLPHVLSAKEVGAKSLEEGVMDFQNFVFLELLYYMNTGDFKKAIGLVPEINKGIKLYSSLMNEPRLLSFCHNLTILFFFMGDYKNALKWSEKIFMKKLDSRQDIQHFVRLLQLIIHYEFSEPSVVEYVYASSLRYFAGRDLITPFEDSVLKLVKKINSTLNKKEKTESFITFINELEQLRVKPLGADELLIWANSKVSRKPMQNIVKEKIAQSRKTPQPALSEK